MLLLGMTTVRQYDADVCIAGGGPAGLATAIATATRGLSVIVVDAGRPPLDKPCGEGLMPDALAALRALGVAIDDDDSASFAGIRFVTPGRSVEAHFPDGGGRGVRRTALHASLLARADSVGVQCMWERRITGLHADTLSLDDRTVRARWIVGADGQQSQIRRWAGLNRGHTLSRRIGMRRHYRIAPWSRFVEVHWGERGQAYITPVGPEQVCVAFITREKQPSIDESLHGFPEIVAKLAGAPSAGASRGAVTLGRRLHRVTRGPVALIGDASGSVDAITGEGLGISFRQAASLADAFIADDLALYETAHRDIARVPLFMSRTMLLMDRFPIVRNHTLQAFERSPQLFARMLQVHVGASPLRWVGDASVLQMGWQLLTA